MTTIMHTAGKGDALAAGYGSAEFESGGKRLPEAQFDKRTMSQAEFLEKYSLPEGITYEDVQSADAAQSPREFWTAIKVRDGYNQILRNIADPNEPEPEPTVVDRRPKYEVDPLDTIEWTISDIKALEPHKFRQRYKEDRRFWNAVHALCPIECPVTGWERLIVVERVPQTKHFLDQANVDAERPVECEIVDPGSESKNRRIIIRFNGGTDVDINGIIYTFVYTEDVLGFLRPGATVNQ